jgi:hypothetical protein
VSLLSILNPIYPTIPAPVNDTEVVLVENAVLQVSIDSEYDLLFFDTAEYNDIHEELVFSTVEMTNQIRIYDELGSMVYLLPVDSQTIKMGRSLFETGQYRIVFDVEGDRRMFASRLEVF